MFHLKKPISNSTTRHPYLGIFVADLYMDLFLHEMLFPKNPILKNPEITFYGWGSFLPAQLKKKKESRHADWEVGQCGHISSQVICWPNISEAECEKYNVQGLPWWSSG